MGSQICLAEIVAWCATCYADSHDQIIQAQRSSTLFETGSTVGIQAHHAKRLRMQLTALDTARTIEDMQIPGFRLHPLKGDMQGRWSVTVNANWRLTFEFKNGDAYVLDYEDYH